MTYWEYQAMVQKRHRALDLVPSLLVLVLTVLPTQPDLEGAACTTDSNQFACWLGHGPRHR